MKLGTMRHAAILGAFCLGFGIVLAMTERLAAEDIATRATEDRLSSLTQVLPAAIYDNNPLENTLVVKEAESKDVTVFQATKAGKVTGVAYEIRGTGYAGEIRLMMGVDADGRILGVRVLAHKETPGLGDRIETKKGDWILRFTGLSLDAPPLEKWKVKKDGGQFDQFAGATITPRGVVAAVRRGLEFFRTNQAQLTGVKP
ncbi:MAG TPA: electron transport complex subunit RsxG [Zoogloea sp.]|jgi:electron transport complex protein RnfG|uniref:electron transport complex subunit RsxG n=1 Tax=Zoogloea sp. TaxID=49181 RepID=UPI002B5E92DA|nr:electron transport complex subunit RsxG [Zoogloea sp.]HOB46128.1 electron transport complex subunit RsxG [Zoogloea sp.]HQA10081.1 electron transport complex subunit RsxG [Zoogloea sp.]